MECVRLYQVMGEKGQPTLDTTYPISISAVAIPIGRYLVVGLTRSQGQNRMKTLAQSHTVHIHVVTARQRSRNKARLFTSPTEASYPNRSKNTPLISPASLAGRRTAKSAKEMWINQPAPPGAHQVGLVGSPTLPLPLPLLPLLPLPASLRAQICCARCAPLGDAVRSSSLDCVNPLTSLSMLELRPLAFMPRGSNGRAVGGGCHAAALDMPIVLDAGGNRSLDEPAHIPEG